FSGVLGHSRPRACRPKPVLWPAPSRGVRSVGRRESSALLRPGRFVSETSNPAIERPEAVADSESPACGLARLSLVVPLSMDRLRRDLRTALRQLWRFPGLSIAVIATLAIGLGANTALFAVVETLLLRPLPLPDAGRLVTVGLRPRADSGALPMPLSQPDLEGIGRDSPALQSFAGYRREQVTARPRGRPRPPPPPGAPPAPGSPLPRLPELVPALRP